MAEFVDPRGVRLEAWVEASIQAYPAIQFPVWPIYEELAWRLLVDELQQLNPELVVQQADQFLTWQDWAEAFMDDVS